MHGETAADCWTHRAVRSGQRRSPRTGGARADDGRSRAGVEHVDAERTHAVSPPPPAGRCPLSSCSSQPRTRERCAGWSRRRRSADAGVPPACVTSGVPSRKAKTEAASPAVCLDGSDYDPAKAGRLHVAGAIETRLPFTRLQSVMTSVETRHEPNVHTMAIAYDEVLGKILAS
jgi:hypothetical protein